MTAQKPASWAYAEEFVTESPVVEQARRRGEELGASPVGTGRVGSLRRGADLVGRGHVAHLRGARGARTACRSGRPCTVDGSPTT